MEKLQRHSPPRTIALTTAPSCSFRLRVRATKHSSRRRIRSLTFPPMSPRSGGPSRRGRCTAAVAIDCLSRTVPAAGRLPRALALGVGGGGFEGLRGVFALASTHATMAYVQQALLWEAALPAAGRLRGLAFEGMLARDLVFFEGRGGVPAGDIAHRITDEADNIADAVFSVLNVRYLIVVDDIGMEQCSALNATFEDNGTSSRLLLTTTTQSVANICSHGNGYVYQMNTLGEEDSKSIAFQGVRSPELEQGSARLLQKCDGLPLALISVSDYLKSSNEPTGELCAKLCHDLGSHLNEKHGYNNFAELSKVLHDNYDRLSGYALTCLLYLGIFPNGCPLKRKIVTRRWLAEGYARGDPFRSQEDIADENFRMLIDRNILLSVGTGNNGQVKMCRTHGIMHEFVLHKSMSQGFIAASCPDHPRIGFNVNNFRHLSIHGGDMIDVGASDEDLSRVRSLTVFGNTVDAISYFRKCKLLRVLDLEGCSDLQDDHVKHIGRLWHLKYLSLGGTIRKLPRSIEGLHCLETLDLRRTQIKTLPIQAIELPHIAHLFGKFMLDKDDLKNANRISKLRKFLSANKSNLQTLAGFVTNRRQGFLQFIGQMKNLRKVKVWCEPAANGSSYLTDLSQAIQEFTKVPMDRKSPRSLSIFFPKEWSEGLLTSLNFEPCSEGCKYDLRSLKLHGELLTLPPFVTLLPGLTELCISSATNLTRNLLSALIKLGSLLYLKLVAVQLEDFDMKDGAFPSLRRLCFVLQNPTSALPTIAQGALPNLISLELLCRGLVGLSGIEIRHLKHLKEVTVDSGVTDQTRQDWERAAKNHPNRPRLLLLKSVESKEPRGEASLVMEKRRRDDSGDGLGSRFKKIRLSESSSSPQLQVIVPRSVVMTGRMPSSSSTQL